jgi:hypothetical protein
MSNFSWKLLIGPVVLIVLLAVGYPLYWHYAAWRLGQEVAAWLELRRGEGWSAVHGPPVVDGFPMALRLTLPAPALGADPAGWRWRGAKAVLEVQPWNWRRFRIEPTGLQTVALRVDGVWRQFEAEAARAVFIGGLGGNGALFEGAFDFGDLTLRDAGARLLKTKALRLWFRKPDGGDATANGSLSLVLRMSEAEVTDRLRLPLGQQIARLELDALLRGDLPRDVGAAAIESWRRAGGVIDVETFDLLWGPAGVRAKGTVTLDAKMRPAGAVQAELQGYVETVTALEEARLIRRRDAAAARIALELLAQQNGNGDRVVALPVTARNGVLYLGPIRALVLKPIPFWARSAQTIRPDASR